MCLVATLGVASCGWNVGRGEDRGAGAAETLADGAAARPGAGRAVEITPPVPATALALAGVLAPDEASSPGAPAPETGAAAPSASVPVGPSPTPLARGSTAIPTPTPTLPSPTPEPPPSFPPGHGALAPERHRLPGVVHTWQKWNNCGPSSVMMALSAFGMSIDQLEIAAVLKPDREDTNVSPEELAEYIRGRGLGAIVRPNGDAASARALVAAGLPVIAEQWIDVEGRGEMGHYRVLVGYDDASGELIAMDSYYGADRRLPYAQVEAEWRPFSGVFVAVYAEEQSDALAAALGADIEERAAWSRALQRAAAWAGAEPNAPWAWFALGEARSRLGDWRGSVDAFERANAIGLPMRAYWYQFGFARSLLELGMHERLLAQADVTLETMQGENLEEWHVYRGHALAALGRRTEAREAFERAVAFNPSSSMARAALEAFGAEPADGG